MKNISLIGSTGSIGRQVLEVAANHPDRFKICAIAANRNSEELKRQTERFKPAFCAAAAENADGALYAAEYPSADIVVNAVGGFAGLAYSLRAIRAGKTLALANKETLVCGGDVVVPEAERRNVEIIPVDSEHSAVWQCLNFDKRREVKRIILTASGGPFRGEEYKNLSRVTPRRALCHPTWKMGKKISVDSATLVNKGYEIIEAHVLFNAPYSRIQGVIQPQSIVHSMVEFCDGAVLAQMGVPSMELPIQLALTYPERLGCMLEPLDFSKPLSLEFLPLEREKYPLFDLTVKCGEAGGVMPCAMNAADEEAVAAFLEGKIKYTDILRVAEGVLSSTENRRAESFEQLAEVDKTARAAAEKIISALV